MSGKRRFPGRKRTIPRAKEKFAKYKPQMARNNKKSSTHQIQKMQIKTMR